MHRLARRAVGSEAALGVARALAGEQHGGAARAVLGMDDLRRLQQAEKGLDRRGREELGGEGFLDAIDLGRVQQRIAQAVDAGAESPWRAIAVGGPPELGAVRGQQVEAAVEAGFEALDVLAWPGAVSEEPGNQSSPGLHRARLFGAAIVG